MQKCVSKLTIIGSDNGLSPGRRHYLNQYWNIVTGALGNKFQWISSQIITLFIEENAFKDVVWKMAAILPWPRYVKTCRADAQTGRWMDKWKLPHPNPNQDRYTKARHKLSYRFCEEGYCLVLNTELGLSAIIGPGLAVTKNSDCLRYGCTWLW